LYATYSGGDHAASTAAIAAALGSVIWVVLLVYFDQHRRERLEAMEAETLAAADAAASSAFESSGDELRVAARRVAAFSKWVLPTAALLVGGGLIALGWLRLGPAREMSDADKFVQPAHPGWAISVCLGVAFVGFVFARFVSGMGKQNAWSALRAGAAQSVGVALAGLAIAIAMFVRLAGGPDWPLRYVPMVVAVGTIIVGVEMVVYFILDLYRPRTTGERLRPAFESRLLGFVAAPDRVAESIGEAVNYQFGVDVTSSWFYQLLQRSVALLVLLGGLIAWGLTALVVVQPHQRAMILTFGRVERADVGPGLHVKWPWPVSTVVTPELTVAETHGDTHDAGRDRIVRTTTGVHTMSLGTNPPDRGEGPILWGVQHAVGERFLLAQPDRDEAAAADAGGAPGLATGNGPGTALEAGSGPDNSGALSLVAMEVPVQFAVRDVELFERLAAPGQQQNLLESIGRRLITRFVSTLTVEEVLSGDRQELARAVHAQLEEAYAALNDGRGAGIDILFVGVTGVHPPREVAPNFERVVQAQQVRESNIESATADQIRTLAEVAGSVDLAEEIIAKLDELSLARVTEGEGLRVDGLELEVQKLLERAGGEAGESLTRATAARWREHMGARGSAALSAGQHAAFQAAPGVYAAELYFRALRESIRDARVFITSSGRPVRAVLELQDLRAGQDVFDTQAGAELQQ
jgi:regulator of protease activity HflC (stomatin/prohibitin superfamily)